MMEILPSGVQSFSLIRENDLRYVDKTMFAMRLVNSGRRFFLSRPRRFGKSLFLDTLKCLFEGNEVLFRGLAIHGQWNWGERFPVIRLDFSAGNFAEEGNLILRIADLLDEIQEELKIAANANTIDGRFSGLIRKLQESAGKPVVVLVDEYDKPILSAVNDPATAQRNRDILQSFYSVLKKEDERIRFCFVTGVTQFAHVSLFSGANHLTDITLEPEYSAICGYTESDLDEVFANEIAGLDRKVVRDWYNGYCWRGDCKVYNPVSILNLLRSRECKAWWYRTGTPTFLVDVLMQRSVNPVTLENISITDRGFDAAEIESLSTASLLFQTGYLTIVEEINLGSITKYRLSYPNREVRQSLNESLLDSIAGESFVELNDYKFELKTMFQNGNVGKIGEVLDSVLAGIPYNWHVKSQAAKYEVYFASVIYGFFVGSGLALNVEDATNDGRIDMTVIEPSNIYLFEFKVVASDPTGESLEQLRAKNYAKKYRKFGVPIHLVGVEFSKETKTIVLFDSTDATAKCNEGEGESLRKSKSIRRQLNPPRKAQDTAAADA